MKNSRLRLVPQTDRTNRLQERAAQAELAEAKGDETAGAYHDMILNRLARSSRVERQRFRERLAG